MRQIMVLTGDGKGKTTSAIGTALRTLGHGGDVLVLQFMKESPSGELSILENLNNCKIHQVGKGFFKIQGDHATEEEHKETAAEAITLLQEELKNSPTLVMLDEINVACSMDLIEAQEIIQILEENPKTHFILTGRNAPQAFIDLANLVTEMQEIKHPFQDGKPAQKGIDF